MQFQCPHCRSAIEAREDQAGQVIQCGSCGGQMQLPAAASTPAPAPDQPTGIIRPQAFPGGGARPGQVRCPHCGEDVVGDEARCPHCGTWFDESKKSEERTGPDWEHRARLGWWPAFWGTTKSVLLEPSTTFKRINLMGIGAAFTYGLVCALVASVAAAIYQGLMALLQIGVGASAGGQQAAAAAVMGLFACAWGFFATLVGSIIGMFLSAAFTQIGLMILKCAKHPYEATFRVTAYASGAGNLLNVIPLCGALVGWIWSLVATIIGIAEVHEISYGRAIIAVLMVPLALLTLIGLGIAALVVIVIVANG